MGHEISQFDIPDRQLLATRSQPRVSMMSDLGEAKITRTIFGGAKVRVIREQDRKRRAWLLRVLAAMAIAAAAWQGWIIFQKMQYVAPHVPLSERIQVSAPVFRPAHIAPDPHPSEQKSESLIQTEIDGLLSGPLPRRPPPVLNAAAKPVTSKPLIANKPQTTSVATINNASMNQTDIQRPLKPSAAIQPAATTVATTPQPAANIPAAVVPLANPL
ncbi:MAG TPA: hypothetical protein VIM35_04675, partial [Gallionella sp.]